MSLNQDTKQAQEINFSRMNSATTQSPLFINNTTVTQVEFQKHLSITLNSRFIKMYSV